MIQDIKALPREFWLISIVSVTQMMSSTAFRPLVPQLAVSTGMSGATLGTLFALSGIVPVLMALPVGALADTVGTKAVLVWGALIRASASLMLCLPPGYGLLLASLTASASSFLLIEVGQQSYISRLGKGRDTERNFGWFTFVMGIGMVIGPLVSGIITDHASFRVAFATAGLMALLGLPVIAILREPTRNGPKPRIGPKDLIASCRPLFANPGVMAAIAIPVVLYFNLGAWEIYLPAFLTTRNYTSTQIGVIVSTFTFATMVARPLLSAGSDRLGRHGLTLCCLALGALGLMAVPVLESVPLLAIAAAACGVGRGLLPLLSLVTIADRTRHDQRGLALSIRMMSIRLQEVVNPLAFGLVAGAFGIPSVFFVAGGLMVAAGVAMGLSNTFKNSLKRMADEYSDEQQ